MKNVHRTRTGQHGEIKSDVSQSQNATILQAWCVSAQGVMQNYSFGGPQIQVGECEF